MTEFFQGIVSQNPYGLGYNSVKQAIAAANGQAEFPEFIENDYVLVTSDNIHDENIIKILDPLGSMNLKNNTEEFMEFDSCY